MPFPAILVLISLRGPESWGGTYSNDLIPPLTVGVSHMINAHHTIVIRLGTAAGLDVPLTFVLIKVGLLQALKEKRHKSP